MTNELGLMPLEDAMLEDAEKIIVLRPRGGVLDQIVANDLRAVGWAESDISKFFGYAVPPRT